MVPAVMLTQGVHGSSIYVHVRTYIRMLTINAREWGPLLIDDDDDDDGGETTPTIHARVYQVGVDSRHRDEPRDARVNIRSGAVSEYSPT